MTNFMGAILLHNSEQLLMELTLIVQRLDGTLQEVQFSYFAGSLYPLLRDILQISYRQLKHLLQRCWDSVFYNVLNLNERLDRDEKQLITR